MEQICGIILILGQCVQEILFKTKTCKHSGQNEVRPCLEAIKPEFILRLKIKRNDWLLADTCPQAANH